MAYVPEHDTLGVFQRKIEETIQEVERLLTVQHGEGLSKWTLKQQRALERTASADGEAFRMQKATIDECLRNIRDDLVGQRRERQKVRQDAEAQRAERERAFASELQTVGERYSERTGELVCEYTCKLRALGESWEANAWQQLDRALGTIIWQQAKQVHAANPTAGVADVYARGDLQEYLAAEREGWARSQENDMARLEAEVQQESDGIFRSLQGKLKKMAPEDFLVKPWVDKLQHMAEAEIARLKVLEKQVASIYESEIEAAMWQCEEDYRGYDSELQRILLRSMEERFASGAQMRMLKLALCRWRLDYQTQYQKEVANARRSLPNTARRTSQGTAALQTVQENGERRFLMVRRLMRRMWEHGKVPVNEIHAFLGRVAAVAAGPNADAIKKMYQDELREFGALALVDSADNPAELELWLQAAMPRKKL